MSFENVEGSSTVISKYVDNSVKVVKCLDVATFSYMFHLEMSELISCVEINTCMHAFICLILCVARSSVVSLQVINMWKYIQSTYVLVLLIQGIQIGFYAWTLVWCIDIMASSPCCTWKPINDNTQYPKLQQRNNRY
jgi:CDP-diglyceride synthetase